MNFCSDNVSGICEEILNSLIEANQDTASSYGQDSITESLTQQISDIFEHQVVVFPVSTGSAANALALSALTPPFGVIYCHQNAHIHKDECGAPEFFTSGAKLIPIPGDHGKIDLALLTSALQQSGQGVVHHSQPAVISLSELTEYGTIYVPEEIKTISKLAKKYNLKIHMDGARFANALAFLECSPEELTWKSGVDVLSLGATKNGAMAAEVVIFFDPKLATDFIYRRKRAGHLLSKMRFLSVQLQTYFKNDLWLKNARHANTMAQNLTKGLSKFPEIQLCHRVEGNELFLNLPNNLAIYLGNQGFKFYQWDEESFQKPDHQTIRLITSFNTTPEQIDSFLGSINNFYKTSKN
ncbi:MAG: low specificity L-threonine aldolase [Alphaproteobacteria bacterium]|nr:low specificity L-threonine aldolase [Alphaproteobacteria bacterium]